MLGCLGVWLSEYVIGPKPDMRSEHEPKKMFFIYLTSLFLLLSLLHTPKQNKNII